MPRIANYSSLCVCAFLLLAACGQREETSRPGQAPAAAPSRAAVHDAAVHDEVRLLSPDELTDQQKKFGVSPRRHPSVTYQPDVLIVENGSEALRELSGDGMTWTVDAAAVAQHDIQPGKVIFMTSRAVGRVLAVKQQGDALALTLGPVDLGEVIRDCDVRISQPVDFGKSLSYTLNEMPGGAVEIEPLAWMPDEPTFRHAAWQPVADGAGTPPNRITSPIAKFERLGVRVNLDKDGTSVQGEMLLKMQAPRVEFQLVMEGASVKIAELKVSGGAGTSLAFEGVNQKGRNHQLNERLVLPTDISIPVGGPLPLTITVRQQLIAQTAFMSPGVLRARADYTFSGELGVQYHKPYFTFLGPGNFKGRESLMNSVEGAALNVSAMSLTHQVKVIGGFGAFNFVVGPYAFLNSNAHVTRHADLDTLARCIQTGFNMRVGTGVGYVIPQPVTKAINWFLGALNIKPIKGEGGLEGPSKFLLQVIDVKPQSQACTSMLKQESPPATSGT